MIVMAIMEIKCCNADAQRVPAQRRCIPGSADMSVTGHVAVDLIRITVAQCLHTSYAMRAQSQLPISEFREHMSNCKGPTCLCTAATGRKASSYLPSKPKLERQFEAASPPCRPQLVLYKTATAATMSKLMNAGLQLTVKL